ncbi:MAG: hypothetical protein JNK72_15305 [Myxococcales bacterium]|nr:hypothetical protein [Myxococcales bacterium]
MCTSPLRLCNGMCVDTRFDPSNCGACGTACGTNFFCDNGRCALQCPTGSTPCGRTCCGAGGLSVCLLNICVAL